MFFIKKELKERYLHVEIDITPSHRTSINCTVKVAGQGYTPHLMLLCLI